MEEVTKKNKVKGFSHPQFQTGELVVHPVYGFCRVHAIKSVETEKPREECYVFLIGSSRNQTQVFIPVHGVEAAGLRHPVNRLQAEGILRILQMPPNPIRVDLKGALEPLSACLKKNDLFGTAEAVRDLAALGLEWRETNPEIFGTSSHWKARAQFSRALDCLAQELSFVLKTTRSEMLKKILRCLNATKRSRLKKETQTA